MSSALQMPKDANYTSAAGNEHVLTGARHDQKYTATFDPRSDRWKLRNLLRPHERNYEATVVFTDLPEWIREDAKRYVDHLYTETMPNAHGIQSMMVSLRRLGRILRDFKARPINLRKQHSWEVARHLRESDLSLSYKYKIKSDINKFMAFVRQIHPEVTTNDFQVVLPRTRAKDARDKPLGKSQEDIVETEVSAKIIDACLSDLQIYRDHMRTYIDSVDNNAEYQRRAHRERRGRKSGDSDTKRPLVKAIDLLGRAIKGQALILALCVGRRAAAVCNTRVDVRTKKTEWVNEAGQLERGVMIRFREMKMTNADEDVFCPDAFGEMALQAIRTAKELTEELRRSNLQWKDYLFLIPARQRKKAQVLSPEQMNDYLNGESKFQNGLLQRYNIPSGRVTTHVFRRTRATKAWMGGMQVHEVAHDLGHFNLDTTLRHYIAGSEESRRRYQTLLDHGALSSTLKDLVGGVELVQITLGRRQVETMNKQGRVVWPTRYGYCALNGSGHCIRTLPCYLGPEVESGGCDHHILSPDALSALEEDKAMLEAGIAINSTYPGCRAIVQSLRNQLEVVNRNIELARILQGRVGCGGGGTCGCERQRKQE
jgi:hypothetical protein